MNRIRSFSSQQPERLSLRSLEDAPAEMRSELVDAIYHVCDQTRGEAFPYRRQLDADEQLYLVIEQSLGCTAAGNPVAGRRQRIGRDLALADWQRVYDLIERLWPEFYSAGAHEEYRTAVNRILAGYGVAWDLGEDGRLHRAIPTILESQIRSGFEELSDPRYAAALELYKAASEAYDARPRRSRDACANAFDALESVSKEAFAMPDATFYDVLAEARRRGTFTSDTVNLLEAVNTMRNHHFGHGMAQPFQLNEHEVDFAYLTCISAIVLFARSALPAST